MTQRSTGFWLCLASLAGLALLIQLTAADRYDDWTRLADTTAWVFALMGAGLAGAWSFVSFIMGTAMPSDYGRKLFFGLGLVYLIIAALVAHDIVDDDGVASGVFMFLWFPVVSTIVMGPLVLLTGWYGRKA